MTKMAAREQPEAQQISSVSSLLYVLCTTGLTVIIPDSLPITSLHYSQYPCTHVQTTIIKVIVYHIIHVNLSWLYMFNLIYPVHTIGNIWHQFITALYGNSYLLICTMTIYCIHMICYIICVYAAYLYSIHC